MDIWKAASQFLFWMFAAFVAVRAYDVYQEQGLAVAAMVGVFLLLIVRVLFNPHNPKDGEG